MSPDFDPEEFEHKPADFGETFKAHIINGSTQVYHAKDQDHAYHINLILCMQIQL